MDEELESLVVRVRADTGGFARDVEAMRAQLEGPLAQGVERAGRAMEGALARFVATGKFGFDDLKRVALSVLGEIAGAGVRGGGGAAGGAGGLLSAAIGALGLPGRATGGPVVGGRAYVVGERGPELFVPTSAGRVEAARSRGPVNITVNVNAGRGAADAPFMAKSGAQVARAVRAALARAEMDS